MAMLNQFSQLEWLFGIALLVVTVWGISLAFRLRRIASTSKKQAQQLQEQVDFLKAELQMLSKSSLGVGKRVLEHEKRLHQLNSNAKSAENVAPVAPPPEATRVPDSSVAPATRTPEPEDNVEPAWSSYQQVASLVKEKAQLKDEDLSEAEASLLEMIRQKRAGEMEYL